MTATVYQVQIALRGSKPKIWRRLLVPSSLLLADFHKIIQTSMGWTDSHLHQFAKGRTFYSIKQPNEICWNEMNNIDYKKKKVRISELLIQVKDKITYEYDFGDGWEHDIILEKILPMDNSNENPVCIAGKMNCPPEDCGGIWGYMEMLKVLKNQNHKENESISEWIGEDFDPAYFDVNEVNSLLKRKNYGCLEF